LNDTVPAGSEKTVRDRSLRVRLSILVAGTMIPLLLFAVGLISWMYLRDRNAAFDRVMETVRSIRLVLDSEVNSITAGLQVLALSQTLQHDDIDSFRANAEAFVELYGSESALVLGDSAGRQIINTRAPADATLPLRRNRAGTEAVFRTGRPFYSHVFIGSVSRTPILTIEVPVKKNGEVVYVLSFNPPMRMFQRIVEQQRLTTDWTISLVDQDGVSFARVPNPERTIGQRASATLYAELFKADEAKMLTVSLEGTELLTAFTRSHMTGWTVAAGIASHTLTAPLLRTLFATTAIGLVLLAIGLGFAVRMATHIAEAEALQDLLVNELNHRIKNTLATVQSIASQTFRSTTDTAEAQRNFSDRIVALGRAHSLLNEERWNGADVRNIAESVMEPYMAEPGRVEMAGPHIRMKSGQALALSMVLHELATNAAKYGALSNVFGKVTMSWALDDNQLNLLWRERGGPPVAEPERKGFGSRLIAQGLGAQNGSTEVTYNKTGVVCVIRCDTAHG
jgi:two-component sensor histidine kinase